MATSFLGLLDLPIGSTISLDGQPVLLKRDDFVGFSSIPEGSLHLVTVRGGVGAGSSQLQAGTTVGFLFTSTLMHRFDPSLEEMSSQPVDRLTAENLLAHVAGGLVDQQRVVEYQRLVLPSKSEQWGKLTSRISGHLLRKRGLVWDAKIVPGTFEDDASEQHSPDGSSPTYPDIPVLNSSERQTRHTGTKRFLAKLTANQRTELFLDSLPGRRAFDAVLDAEYEGSWNDLLGDVQLSFVLFLHLHCFASFEHWRDLVAMLSATSSIESTELYAGFIDTLLYQLEVLDADVLEESDLSGDMFLMPAMKRLLAMLDQGKNAQMTDCASRLRQMLARHFSEHFGDKDESDEQFGNGDVDMSVEQDDDDDDDGPVIVSTEEIAATEAWAASQVRKSNVTTVSYSLELQRQYPLLFAAMLPSEDILMTCARALDDARDVSLVREAAAYLEDVEAKR